MRTDRMRVDEHMDVTREAIADGVGRKVPVSVVVLAVGGEHGEDVVRHMCEAKSRLLEQIDACIRLITVDDGLQVDLQQ